MRIKLKVNCTVEKVLVSHADTTLASGAMRDLQWCMLVKADDAHNFTSPITLQPRSPLE
jgi:hypothetical protein